MSMCSFAYNFLIFFPIRGWTLSLSSSVGTMKIYFKIRCECLFSSADQRKV